MTSVATGLLGWTEEALAVVARLRGWTEAAVERLELTWDARTGRVGFPIRDETADTLGMLHYQPDPARRRDAGDKMRQPAGMPRQLCPPPETIGDDELAAGPLLLCEGEPDMVAAVSAGFTAVGVPGTGGWKPEYAARFSGRRANVRVCFDCDTSGRAAGVRVAESLVAAGVDARIVDLDPGRDTGFDLTDYLLERGPDELRNLLADAEPFQSEPEAAQAADPTVTFAEFAARQDDTGRDPILTADQGTLLPAGGLGILSAKVHDGKTTWTVELVQHAAAGRDYLELSFPRPLRVLVIENEGPREAFRAKLSARLDTWEHGGDPRIWDEPTEWGQVRISDRTIRERLRTVIEAHQVDLVVSDSLTRFGVRGNGTPEETREFVEWLTELGLGRDLAFLLLHHPRIRPEQGEGELEQLAGAWQAHADLILLLSRLDGDRARLSFPKTRWAKGHRPPSILAFDPDTESFTYVGDDVPTERDLVAELAAVMADGDWWSVNKLRQPKDKNGIGARPAAITAALADDRFERADGEGIGRRKGDTYYRLREASRGSGDGGDAETLGPEEGEASPSPPSKETVLGGDASPGRDASGDLDAGLEELERLEDLYHQAREHQP